MAAHTFPAHLADVLQDAGMNHAQAAGRIQFQDGGWRQAPLTTADQGIIRYNLFIEDSNLVAFRTWMRDHAADFFNVTEPLTGLEVEALVPGGAGAVSYRAFSPTDRPGPLYHRAEITLEMRPEAFAGVPGRDDYLPDYAYVRPTDTLEDGVRIERTRNAPPGAVRQRPGGAEVQVRRTLVCRVSDADIGAFRTWLVGHRATPFLWRGDAVRQRLYLLGGMAGVDIRQAATGQGRPSWAITLRTLGRRHDIAPAPVDD